MHTKKRSVILFTWVWPGQTNFGQPRLVLDAKIDLTGPNQKQPGQTDFCLELKFLLLARPIFSVFILWCQKNMEKVVWHAIDYLTMLLLSDRWALTKWVSFCTECLSPEDD